MLRDRSASSCCESLPKRNIAEKRDDSVREALRVVHDLDGIDQLIGNTLQRIRFGCSHSQSCSRSRGLGRYRPHLSGNLMRRRFWLPICDISVTPIHAQRHPSSKYHGARRASTRAQHSDGETTKFSRGKVFTWFASSKKLSVSSLRKKSSR
jgi:hypothetical protein